MKVLAALALLLLQDPPRRDQPGPWDGDAWLYESKDGLRFTRSRKLVEGAGVPTLAADARGRLAALFQWFPKDDDAAFDRVAAAFSEDDGRSWTPPKPIVMRDYPKELQRPFDPTIVPTEDGKFRLYFTSVEKKKPPAIYSAISDDAVTWRFEPGVRLAVEGQFVIDCAAARLGDEWHLYSPVQGRDGVAYHAVSRDGLRFERREDVELPISGSWLGCAVALGDRLRFYGSGAGGWSATSKDGQTWTLDRGTSREGGADPGVARTSGGGWLMIATEPRRLARGGDRRAYLDHMRAARTRKPTSTRAFDPPKSVSFGRRVDLGAGGFPRALPVGGRLYAFLALGESSRVLRLDENLRPDGFEKTLTPKGQREVDHDLAVSGDFVFHYAMLPGGAGQVRKYDGEFNLVAKTDVFRARGTEMILDQNIAVIDGRVYAGGEYREKGPWPFGPEQNIPPDAKQARGAHLRIFDLDLKPVEERDLTADIEGAAVRNQFWGLGTSQVRAGGYHCLVVHTPVGNVAKFPRGESIGARGIFVLRYDDRFRFVDATGPLSDTDRDNFWCTGSWFEGGRLYVAYVSASKGCVPGPGENLREPVESNLRLGIFDEKFQEIETVDLTKPGEGGGLPDVVKSGDRLYVTYVSERGRAVLQELLGP